MRRCEKGKIAGIFMHSFAFPQFVEKQVEKQKSAVNAKFFRVLKKFSIFNIFRSGYSYVILFFFPGKTGPISFFAFPHFFSHFFLFHSASFQEFPQASRAPDFSTKRIFFSASNPPPYTTEMKTQKSFWPLAFSDFSNFSTNPITITPKNS